MNTKFINTYIKYTAKKPILFFSMIAVGISLIAVLAITTKTSVMVTYDGLVDSSSVVVNAKIDSYTGVVYAYSDRNEGEYPANISQTIHKNRQTIFILKDNKYIAVMDHQKIKLEVPIKEITILQLVFLKGGKATG